MKNISLLTLFIILVFVFSCKTKSKSINDNFKSVSLDANSQSNNTTKLIYNSMDTIPRFPTTLIINKNVIPKKMMKSVLDTIKMQDYFVEINREKRIIKMTKK